jgi:hypothetical protein
MAVSFMARDASGRIDLQHGSHATYRLVFDRVEREHASAAKTFKKTGSRQA